MHCKWRYCCLIVNTYFFCANVLWDYSYWLEANTPPPPKKKGGSFELFFYLNTLWFCVMDYYTSPTRKINEISKAGDCYFLDDNNNGINLCHQICILIITLFSLMLKIKLIEKPKPNKNVAQLQYIRIDKPVLYYFDKMIKQTLCAEDGQQFFVLYEHAYWRLCY